MATIKKETLDVLKKNPKAAQLSPSDSLNVYIGVADKFNNKTRKEINDLPAEKSADDLMDNENPASLHNKAWQYMVIHKALLDSKKNNTKPEMYLDEMGKMFYKNLIQKYGNQLIDNNTFDEYLNIGKGQNSK